MKIFGYNNFSTVRTPFNGTIDAIDRPSQEYRELPFQFIQEVDTGATAKCVCKSLIQLVRSISLCIPVANLGTVHM